MNGSYITQGCDPPHLHQAQLGPPSMAHYLYIVRCSDKTLYIGTAVNIAARIKKHNLGKGAKYTRARKPVKLVYQEKFTTLIKARKRERLIKEWPRDKKLQLIKRGRQRKKYND